MTAALTSLPDLFQSSSNHLVSHGTLNPMLQLDHHTLPNRMSNGKNEHVIPRANASSPLKGLKRYKILSLIGDGTYGLVYSAYNQETKEKVAIKTMKRKYSSWDEVMSLREVRSLKKLHHPNVVKLKEVIRENSRLFFVFEYVRGDLLGMMKEKTAGDQDVFPESWIRSVISQVLQGLSYMHRLGFFHRDLKPENILAAGPDVVKIADFGLAREIRSAPPFTDYVSTRWYRAPEVLLRSTNYSSPIDIWAIGCITCELFTKRPLFPGTSEIDQLFKICSILGTPSRSEWSEGFSLANAMSFKFPTFTATHLSQILGSRSSAHAVSFLYALLSWNPSWRCSAQDALRHAFLRGPKADTLTRRADSMTIQGSAMSFGNRSTNKELLRPGMKPVRNPNHAKEVKEEDKNNYEKEHVDDDFNDDDDVVHVGIQESKQRRAGKEENKDDISDLISTFGLSPDPDRHRKPSRKSNHFRESIRRIPPTVSQKAVATWHHNYHHHHQGNTLKEKLPKFANLDDKPQLQQQPPHGSKPAEKGHFSNGSVPRTNSSLSHSMQTSNGTAKSYFPRLQLNLSPIKNGKKDGQRGPFSTNMTLAETSPLYNAEMFTTSMTYSNKFFSPSPYIRSIPNFEVSNRPTLLASKTKYNGVVPNGNPAEVKKVHDVHVRTNWAAKYLK